MNKSKFPDRTISPSFNPDHVGPNVITLRDVFAGLVAHATIVGMALQKSDPQPKFLADVAYLVADEMLKIRDGGK